MIWHADELISTVHNVLVRAALAHQDLLVAAQGREANKCTVWQDVQLSALRELAETIKRHRAPAVDRLTSSIKMYETAAQALVGEVRADNATSLDAEIANVRAAYSQMRTAAEAALTRGRRAKAVLGVTSWLSATALSTAIAIGTFLFQQNREEQKKAPSRDLGRSAACNDADWVDRGALARSPEIVCQAWEFTAWRAASGYRVEAFARARGVNLMRTVVHPQGASSSAIRPVQGEDGPKASLSFWVCEVPNGAPFRLVAWSQPRGEIHAVAYVQEQGVPPC